MCSGPAQLLVGPHLVLRVPVSNSPFITTPVTLNEGPDPPRPGFVSTNHIYNNSISYFQIRSHFQSYWGAGG